MISPLVSDPYDRRLTALGGSRLRVVPNRPRISVSDSLDQTRRICAVARSSQYSLATEVIVPIRLSGLDVRTICVARHRALRLEILFVLMKCCRPVALVVLSSY